MDAEALAKLIVDAMSENASGVPWMDDDRGLTEVIIDGRFDMLKVAEAVLVAVNPVSK